ncbi:MAG TPA: hypothetical protein VFG07_06480 [Thermoplasmata archaeon]|nr:hypothetical protein [Thermoplasmata archaeon]
MTVCPFCGAPQTDRVDLEGKRFLVFQCLFTPEVDPSWDDTRIGEELRSTYGSAGAAYFRGMCDRLHLYVTKGKGAQELLAPGPAADSSPAP